MTLPVASPMKDHAYLLPGQGDNGRVGVLLIHGLTGTPNEMRLIARGLQKQGFTVYALQLAGHCGDVDDLLATGWRDWMNSAREGARHLAAHTDRIIAVGLSMGALLALGLAEEKTPKLAGVVALSTTFRHDGWSMPFYTRFSFLLPLCRALGIGAKRVFFEMPPYGIKDEAIRARIVAQMQSGDSSQAGLPGNPWWSIGELQALARHVRRRLSLIEVPCLAVHARHDDVAALSNAQDIKDRVQKAPVELVVLDDSYHMVTIDRERRRVIACVTDFADRIARQNQTATEAAA